MGNEKPWLLAKDAEKLSESYFDSIDGIIERITLKAKEEYDGYGRRKNRILENVLIDKDSLSDLIELGYTVKKVNTIKPDHNFSRTRNYYDITW